MKLIGRIKISAVLTVETPLHIGGMRESYRIGDADNPVIKIKLNRRGIMQDLPYIPGSSLKGKIRSLIEEKERGSNFCKCGNCKICKLFGTGAGEEKSVKSRLRVRDGYLSANQMKEIEDANFTEIKMENTIDRIEGKAKNPRQNERVLPDTKFDLEFIINIYDNDNAEELLGLLFEGLELLEDDYLGGSGTRGCGKVSISKITISYKSANDYAEGKDFQELGKYDKISDAIKKDEMSKIVSKVKN